MQFRKYPEAFIGVVLGLGLQVGLNKINIQDQEQNT